MTVEVLGIDRVIRRLERMKRELESKNHEFIEKLALEGIEVADSHFSNAIYDGVNDVSPGQIVWLSDNEAQIVVSGTTVLFIEFGTGITYTDQHELAGKYGYVRVGYGQGKGANPKGWIYKGEPGTNGIPVKGRPAGVYRTKGNPPARAMYLAGKAMRDRVEETAREVFGNG